jgi:hypothetical protein
MATKSLPTCASPVTTMISSGAKVSAIAWRSSSANRGVSSDGLIITRLPAAIAAMAGPIAN